MIAHHTIITRFFLILGITLLISCGTSKPYYADPAAAFGPEDKPLNKEIDYSIYLIGDAGLPNLSGEDKVLSMLANHLRDAGSNNSVLFLGDNIYENGMPAETSGEERRTAEKKIAKSLETFTDFPGQAYFIPGNHDWRFGKERVLAQESFIENYTGAKAEFIPSNGCPGPVSINLSQEWRLIAFDSEWWISQSLKSGVSVENCQHQTRDDVINEIGNIVSSNPQQNILMAVHHPLYSNGPHGGYFNLKDHLFPLTNLKKWLYLPLPVIGSTYPIYRKLGQSKQDLPNSHYQELKDRILQVTENADNIFFASGHEHSLEYFEKDNHFAIVSGSGSKVSFARRGQGAQFVYSQKGFARLTSYKDHSIYLEFWVPGEGNEKGRMIYQKRLTKSEPAKFSDIDKGRKDVIQAEKKVAAGPIYEAGKFKRFLWGDHYRDAWTTPIEVPTIDLNTKYGGLEVLNVGGGQQSVAITVQDTAGQKYVLSSVQKDPSKALPEELRETFARDIVQDQISSSHPYSDLIISPLAEAAGIYHTNPELLYITEEAGLEFTDDSGGALVFLEEFVNEAWFNDRYTKQADDVLNTDKLWQKLHEDNYNRVNEKQLLRTRLFDMFLGDWDRHDGQWFWAETTSDNGALYEPIPIDRDNAFFKSDGVIPKITNRKWALRKFQHFDEGIRDIAGINLNAKDFDRWFLTELSKNDWLQIAKELKKSLSDDVIENAVQQWPKVIYELDGSTVTHNLKTRRDKIDEFASRYYDILSKEVNVFGSNEREWFAVNRKENGETQVAAFSLNENGEKGLKTYERKFLPEETGDIRLYGFGGDDKFEITGTAKSDILVRIIGGEGLDVIDDKSGGANGKLTEVYDTKAGSVINDGGGIIYKTTENPAINQFRKESFQYDYFGPLLTGGFNSDDGIFLGGGVVIKNHGFRKEPFATMHEIKGKHATLTSAFAFDYKSVFTEAIADYDFIIDLNVRAPNFKSNFFGLGNETEKSSDSRSFYRFRFDQVLFSTTLKNDLSSITSYQLGTGYKLYEASFSSGRFVTTPDAGLEASDFKAHHYMSLNSEFNISTTDNEINPKYGIKFNADADLNIGLNNRSDTFSKFGVDASLYYTLNKISSTVAVRAGASTNIGEYEFFQANTLGGNTLLGEPGNLRGFLRDRFAGRTNFYQNVEVRTRLLNFKSYLFPADVGILGFFDNGRVWIDDESSDEWHQGYGGGIWFNPFKRMVITTTYSISKEEKLLSVNFGFGF